ncbi:sulfotransferase family protein [Parvularcula lutaonensis]|uniref:Sulfotransferase family protein n=1 Tax=Parvularcula lutaonensis TaxID=491923 RepID=A0ABV7MBR9_9PROT|nr:sulfotransferase [Parvularcula lutaonensis]GGY38034.1 sulfotransferase [Parvularcula lutaonensis]
MRPSFIVIGGTKCGTTSLYSSLADHPGIFLAPKELRFFTIEHRWRRGEGWYRSQFAAAPRTAVSGEFSNAYTRDPVYACPASRIARMLPEVRLVYLVRDPFERLASHYRHRFVTGAEWRNPSRAIGADDGYVAASLYGHQLNLFRQHFPEEQIKVIDSARLFSEPTATLAEICSFVGADTDHPLELRRENASAERHVVPPMLRSLARFPALRPVLKKTPAAMRAIGLQGVTHTADNRKASLPDEMRRRLERRFAEDFHLLRSLAGNVSLSWSFGQDGYRGGAAGGRSPMPSQEGRIDA